MTSLPMRPWQNALAIVAAFFVAGALLPWSLRLACALAAIGIVMLLFVMRIRSHVATQEREHTAGVYEKIERMRATRDVRAGRRPPARRGDQPPPRSPFSR
jgi:hypothetical protein